MPTVQTIGSLSTHAVGGITHASSTKPPSDIPYAGSAISPSFNGQPLVDLDRVTLSTCGSWAVTPLSDFYSNVKIWGAGGGAPLDIPGFQFGVGGQGGFTKGNILFKAGISYTFVVGCGGSGSTTTKYAAGGGGGSGIKFTSNSVPIVISGAGGGCGYSGAQTVYGGNGGGTTGQNGYGNAGGGGGTQSAGGAGGVGGRRSGSPGTYLNGGGGATTGGTAGGAGLGNGGTGGAIISTGPSTTDAGAGGGGGGYYGGGGGGGGADGSGGGGGSSYYDPAYVTLATITQGYGSDSDRGTAGGQGFNGAAGSAGKIKITLNPI
jgi:hypothetical protein